MVIILTALFFGCGRESTYDKERTLELVTVRNAGFAGLEENKLDEAEAAFKHMIEIAPDEVIGYANLGLVYLRSRQFEDAEVQFVKALALEPGNPIVLLNLTEIYILTNREGAVLGALEEAHKHSPNHAKTLYRLAKIYLASSDKDIRERGLEYLGKVVEILPANIAVRLQLIEILIRDNKFDTALAHMETLRAQIPALPEDSGEFFAQSMELLKAQKSEESLVPTMRFHNLLKSTLLYRSGILDLESFRGPFIGTPVLSFTKETVFEEQA